MATTTYIGTGEIISADFRALKWVGKTKGGQDVIIEVDNAINTGNIEWTMAEKNDVVQNVEFEGCYTNTNSASASNTEPWRITIDGATSAGASEIVLGAGTFYIDNTAVALTRGGGTFTVEREAREINADGDRGKVKDRVVYESSRPKLAFNALTIIKSLTSLYSGIAASV